MPSTASSGLPRWPALRVVDSPPGASHVVDGVTVLAAPGGLADAVTVVAEALAPLGVPVSASTPDQAEDAADPGPRSLRLEVRSGADLPAQGYALRVTAGPDGVRAVVEGADGLGAWYGLRTLGGMLAPADGTTRAEGAPEAWTVPEVAVRDWPTLLWRGSVEGFYGPPWTHADRLEHLRLAGLLRFTTYVYAPKDDPYHRERWREPYPEDELAQLAELVAAADAERVELVFAISPGLSMRYSDERELAALVAKARQVRDVGVRRFALLFDDIPPELQHPEDLVAFGSGPGSAGAAHGVVAARFEQALEDLDAREGADPSGRHDGARVPRVVVCPTDYAGTGSSAYREQLARTLPADVPLWWTGADIVVDEVTRTDAEAARAAFGRDLVLWDNFPVNDFDRARLFLGPLVGRASDLDGTVLRGISTNPMVEAAPSALPVATVGLWAWDPAAYDPDAATAWALEAVVGPFAEVLAPLVDACRGWPSAAPQSPRLTALAAAALDADDDARATLRAELDRLGRVADRLADAPAHHARLAEQVGPWADAARDVAAAGTAALDVLTATDEVARGTEPPDAVVRATDHARAALTRAEGRYPNVLRAVVLPFVRDVLARVSGEPEVSDGPVALLVTGERPAPGDESLAEVLRARGLDVRTTGGADPREVAGEPALVVVTRSATPEDAVVAAALPAPLVTWANLVALGVATDADVLTVQETLVLSDDGADLAEDLAPGGLRVYRGPGTVTWGEPGPEGTVLARTVEGRAAITRYPPGARLADGTTAAHGRTALFLGREGMSPWLMTDEGRALVVAVLDRVLADAALPAVP